MGLAAVLCHVSFLFLLPHKLATFHGPDYWNHYVPLAEGLLEGKAFRTPSGIPDVVYPPGYPVILAGILCLSRATGLPGMTVHQLFNIATGAIATLLLFGIARSFFGRGTALLGCLVWMTYPLFLWFTKQPNTEFPFMLALFGGIHLLLRSADGKLPLVPASLAVGALIGAASLIRPFAIALSAPFMLALWILLPRRRVSRRLLLCGLLLIGNLAAILPWEFWVYRESGLVIPLCTNGRVSLLDGLMLDIRPEAPGQIIPIPEDVRQLIRTITESDQQLESVPAIGRFLGRALRTKPLTVLKLAALKAARAWYATDSQRFEPYVAALQIPYGLLVVAGAVAAWRLGGNARRFLFLLVPFVLYFWAMTMAVLSIVRYMLPVLALLSLLVGLALATILHPFFPGLAPRDSAPA